MHELLILVLNLPQLGTLLEMGWDSLTCLAIRLPEVVSYEAKKFIILLDCCPNLDLLIFGPATAGSLHPPSYSYPNLHMLVIILHGKDKDSIFNLICKI